MCIDWQSGIFDLMFIISLWGRGIISCRTVLSLGECTQYFTSIYTAPSTNSRSITLHSYLLVWAVFHSCWIINLQSVNLKKMNIDAVVGWINHYLNLMYTVRVAVFSQCQWSVTGHWCGGPRSGHPWSSACYSLPGSPYHRGLLITYMIHVQIVRCNSSTFTGL